MLISFFWVIPPASSFYVPTFRINPVRSNFIGRVKVIRTVKMEQTDCIETSAHKIESSGDNPIERIQLCEIDVYFLKDVSRLKRAVY
jgi:hypothetical protein